MTGTEQHTGFRGRRMDEDRRLTITRSYERTWQRLRYRAVEDITECQTTETHIFKRERQLYFPNR